ncbi:LysE family translocator [Herbaspirillum sp. VT-16-41]|uniref:LysE family translocator n=1 Tax=Herbaspirillum sp. VT-16-41 TaxID=1953765 RepID=UPI000981D01C|nr:LysE family translocator [Herbaspirillum sp. VT-16-41]ONN64573.1 hypothetical protein BTM36_20865 [Herbaspirillum sp. VT-16-41]
MPFDTWILFCVSAFFSAASPGPSVVHAMKLAGNNGFRRATASIIGNTFSIIIICAVASAGLAMLALDGPSFFLVKLLGALYLIYSGVKTFLAADEELIGKDGRKKAYMACMLEAILISVTNPKIFVFIASFFPQFLSKKYDAATQLVVMTLTFSFFTSATLIAYSLFAALMYKKKLARIFLNRGSGIALILFGGFMLVQ